MAEEMIGKKFDGGKLRWDLLPWQALEPVARVIQAGAVKYGEYNWMSGFAYSRCFAAVMRHLWAWFLGEDRDPETRESHLAHAVCTLLFLLDFEARKAGQDDRRKTLCAPK